jgi:hypothetical protein
MPFDYKNVEDSWFTMSPEDRRANLVAIYDYVRNARNKINEFPRALPIIESFESWYQGLGWYSLNVDIGATTDEARRRRHDLNKAMDSVTAPDKIPFDAPQTPPPAPEPVSIFPRTTLGTKVFVWSVFGLAGLAFTAKSLSAAASIKGRRY